MAEKVTESEVSLGASFYGAECIVSTLGRHAVGMYALVQKGKRAHRTVRGMVDEVEVLIDFDDTGRVVGVEALFMSPYRAAPAPPGGG